MADHHASDPCTVILGSNGGKAPRASSLNKPDRAKSPKGRLPDPTGSVDVYIDRNYIETVPLKLGIRFSKTFAIAFPKSADAELMNQLPKTVTIEKATAGVGNLSIATSGDDGPAQRAEHQLNLKLDTLIQQPEVASFKSAFNWMDVIQEIPKDDRLSDFAYHKPRLVSVYGQINWYAASLVLQLRPAARQLVSDIMMKLTVDAPTTELIVYIYNHLPPNDTIMSRAITSIYEHKVKGAYSVDDLQAFTTCLKETDDALYQRYLSVGRHHITSRAKAAKDSSDGLLEDSTCTMSSLHLDDEHERGPQQEQLSATRSRDNKNHAKDCQQQGSRLGSASGDGEYEAKVSPHTHFGVGADVGPAGGSSEDDIFEDALEAQVPPSNRRRRARRAQQARGSWIEMESWCRVLARQGGST